MPGAFELPLVAKHLAESGRCDAVICLGAVIRGDTPHFDYVAGEAARGSAGGRARPPACPIVFGVLTTDTLAAGARPDRRPRGPQGGGSGEHRARDDRIAAPARQTRRPAARPTRNAPTCCDSSSPRARSSGPRFQLFEDADLTVRAQLGRRLPRHDRRPARHRRHASCGPRRSRATSPSGLFDVGITGRDWIEETGAEVVTLTELHYSKATARPIRMVLAVAGDSPVAAVEDLPAGVRVHTEYPELTRRFFTKAGVDAEITLSYGATEAKIPEIADAVVEITETGRALRAAGLQDPRHDPRLVHRADRQPGRVRRPGEAQGDGADPDAAHRRARGARPGAREAQRRGARTSTRVIALLPALKSPTVSKLFGEDGYAVETVVAKSRDQHPDPGAEGRRRHRHHRAADREDRPLTARVPA